jgi:Leucine-rich repeat (LRR) protein
MEKYDIFICYRRDGGESMGMLLHNRLTAMGYRVFLDIEGLNSGNFNTELYRIIEGCTDFLVICSKDGFERCANQGDWVRLEIAHALKHGKNIIPVLLRGFEWPNVLPDDINDLRTFNGITANTHEYFDAILKRLCDKFLKSTPKSKKPLIAFLMFAIVVLAIGTAAIVYVIQGSSANNPNPDGTAYTDPPPYTADAPREQGANVEYITVKGVQYSTSLETLSLHALDLYDRDIEPLRYMINLVFLDIGLNNIQDLSPIAGLNKLEVLFLNENRLTDLSPVSGLTNLTELYFSTNLIKDISPLSSLTSLGVIMAWDNEIEDLSPLGSLNQLWHLNVSGNHIRDLTPLSQFNSETVMHLSINPITDWSPVAHVSYVNGRP